MKALALALSLVLAPAPAAAQQPEKPPPSVAQLEAAVKRSPSDPKLHVALGLAYWEKNDYPRALIAFQRAVEVAPKSAEASGSSYYSQNDFRLHFGLGALTRAELVEIAWPSGVKERLANVPANQLHVCHESKGIVSSRNLR